LLLGIHVLFKCLHITGTINQRFSCIIHEVNTVSMITTHEEAVQFPQSTARLQLGQQLLCLRFFSKIAPLTEQGLQRLYCCRLIPCSRIYHCAVVPHSGFVRFFLIYPLYVPFCTLHLAVLAGLPRMYLLPERILAQAWQHVLHTPGPWQAVYCADTRRDR